MPLSDLLFSKTHNVDQMVDIKSRKKVDKVLLKVIKTVRDRGSISAWIKPTSDLRIEFNMTDRQVKSVCGVLNEYYNTDMNPTEMKTPGDMVLFIKNHRQMVTDSMFLINGFEVDEDQNDDLTAEPKENLEVKKEILEESEPSDPVKEDVKGEPSTEKDKPAVPIDAVGKVNNTSDEGLLEAIGITAGAAGLIYAAIKLYQGHNWDKLVEFMEKNYTKIVKDIRENHKTEEAFAKNRAILYKVNELHASFADRVNQLQKIKAMPLPYKDEPLDLYQNKLSAYFKTKMEVPAHPGDPSYLTLEEAGYLSAFNVTPLIKKIKEAFDLQDEVDKILFPYLKHTEHLEYAPAIKTAGVANYFHALYQESWTEHFSEHVLRAIVNGLEGKPNKDIGKSNEQIEASMETLAPTVSAAEPPAESWSDMLASF